MSGVHQHAENISFVVRDARWYRYVVPKEDDEMIRARSRIVAAAVAAALIHLPSTTPAQLSRPITIPEPMRALTTSAPVTIDGRLDEPIWRLATQARRLTKTEPDAGWPETHPTDVRMLVTADAVIIGARLKEPGMREILSRCDSVAPFSVFGDHFEVQLDPHAKHITAFAFAVTPTGVRRTALVAEDGRRDHSWVIHWTAVTRAEDDGWTVEIRIPLSELHIRREEAQWGIQIIRYSGKRQETDQLNIGGR
jgi:hypothetical protein